MRTDIICDEGECPYMDDNKGCMVKDYNAICPRERSCYNCSHRKWRVVDKQWNKDYVCDIDLAPCGTLCSEWKGD